MMPIRDVVIFPHMMTPFVVGRESSVRALEEALAADKKIFLATQHDASIDEPKPNEIYQVGTIVNIVQSLKLPDGNIKVLVEGVERGRIVKVSTEEGHFRVTVKTASFRMVSTPSLEQLVQRVTSLFEQYVKLSQSLNYETMIAAVKVDEIGKFTDTVAQNLNVSIEEKQELLEIWEQLHVTVIFVTHSVGEAVMLVEQVIRFPQFFVPFPLHFLRLVLGHLSPKRVSDQLIRLPFHNALTGSEQEQVIDLLREFPFQVSYHVA